MKSDKNLVIGITGRRGSGKNAVAGMLDLYLWRKYDTNCHKFAFADLIKEELCKYTGGHLNILRQNKEILRPVLQFWGDLIRDRLIPTIDAKIAALKSPYLVIIPDVRLLKEAEYLKAKYNAVILHIERRKLDDNGMYLPLDYNPNVDNHPTEREVDLICGDYRIMNTGSLEYLSKLEVRSFADYLLNHNLV